MPIHDWTKVNAGTFHDFHTAWIVALRSALNAGILPSGFYALAEQVATNIIPDVLTLQDMASVDDLPGGLEPPENEGGVAVATKTPAVALRDTISESMLLAARRRRIMIRRTTGDRIVALLEIVSPGNKETRSAVDQFVQKAVGAQDEGLHHLVVDLFPPPAEAIQTACTAFSGRASAATTSNHRTSRSPLPPMRLKASSPATLSPLPSVPSSSICRCSSHPSDT
jgi:hypothetical protein